MLHAGRTDPARSRVVLPAVAASLIAALATAAPALAASTRRAQFTWSPKSPVTGQAVTFDASGSACGRRTPCSYKWEDDGSDGSGGTQWSLGSGKQLKFTFHGAGTKYVRVKVYNARGTLRAQVEHNVVVTAGSGSPPPPPPPSSPPPPPPPPPPGDTTAPDTIIDSAPSDGTSTTASFTFHATETATFTCALDRAAPRACSSPVGYTGVAVGSHTFSVTATDRAGNADRTPAARTWTVRAPAPPPSASCRQTVSGANVVAAAASAPNGSTLCVTAGSYPAVTFSSARSGYVTIKPASGTVTFADLNTSDAASYYRFQGLHIGAMVDIGNRSSSTGHNIDVVQSYLTGLSVWSGMTDVLIDHNDIEGGSNQLESIGGTRVTVNGNRFANAGDDAMYITSGWKDWTITNNEITGVMENGDHSDCLQSYAGGSGMTFSGNYEHDNLCQGFFVKDGAASNITFANNLFIKGVGSGDTTNVYEISNLQAHDNTIWDGKGFMLRGGGGPAAISDNVVDSFSTTDSPWTGVSEGDDWFGQVSNFTPSSSTHVGGTPPFANPSAGDYRLTDGSGRGVDWTPSQKHFGP